MAITPQVPSPVVERLPSLRVDLARSRAWLEHEIAARQRYLALPSDAAETGIGHAVAKDLYECELHLVELASFERDLRDVEAALGRMRCGIYGTCLDCGRSIPLDRLARCHRRPATSTASEPPSCGHDDLGGAAVMFPGYQFMDQSWMAG